MLHGFQSDRPRVGRKVRRLLGAAILVATGSLGGGPPSKAWAAETPASRVPWVSSQVQGSPDPEPLYKPERVWPTLTFDEALEIVTAPGLARLFVLERYGRIDSIADDPAAPPDRQPFADLKSFLPKFDSVYGMAFHPAFPRKRQVFLCYTQKRYGAEATRVSRFEVSGEPTLRLVPASEQVLFTFTAGSHNGGNLRFGPDGYLYVSTGDAQAPSPPDPLNTGQDLTDLTAAVLRIDVDHTGPTRPYAIPADNPFVNTPGARPEIYAYGLRNPWKMAFHPHNGSLWVGDVGWEAWEMIYDVKKGGNYGWPIVEGPQSVRKEAQPGPTPILPPVIAHPHTEAASITGGYVYRGQRLPALAGRYVYGDYVTGKIWALPTDPPQPKAQEIASTNLKIVSFGESGAGELFFLDWGNQAGLYRLAPNPHAGRSAAFPTRLSETGVFREVAAQVPSPGVYEFQINLPAFADGAISRRFVGLPGEGRLTTRLTTRNDGRTVLGTSRPKGAVFVKTLALPSRRPGAPARNIETQLLHFDGETWRGYSYRWNEAQTDADLVPGEGEVVRLAAADGESPASWRFPARSECLRCHNPHAGTLLSFQPGQLARAARAGTPSEGQRLADLGLVDPAFVTTGATYPVFAPKNHKATLEARARSWLHVNCSHCHRFQAGGSVAIEVNLEPPLARTGLVGASAMQGDLGLEEARIVAPGDPWRSVLYARVATPGRGHMPLVGPRQVDPEGLALLRTWITSLGTQKERRAAAARQRQIVARYASPRRRSEPLTNVSDALALLDALERGVLKGKAAAAARGAGVASPDVVIADLFRRFDPNAGREEMLGEAPALDGILARAGDPVRGAKLFGSSGKGQCTLCHKMGDEGRDFGPDLSTIGARYEARELLLHILSPNAKVDPAFVAVSIGTKAGDGVSGFVVEEDARTIVLKVPTGDRVRIAKDDVEVRTPLEGSLMPEGLLQMFTAQEAADLLTYLKAKK